MQRDIVSAAKWFGLCLVAASLILAAGINIAVLQHGSQTSTVKLHLDSFYQNQNVKLQSAPGDAFTVRVIFSHTTPKK